MTICLRLVRLNFGVSRCKTWKASSQFELFLIGLGLAEILLARSNPGCSVLLHAFLKPFDYARREGQHISLKTDLYFHTEISDPDCVAVAELILAERGASGVVEGEYSTGWALLPLHKGRPSSKTIRRKKNVRAKSSPVMEGSPRYLLFQGMFGEQVCHSTQ